MFCFIWSLNIGFTALIQTEAGLFRGGLEYFWLDSSRGFKQMLSCIERNKGI